MPPYIWPSAPRTAAPMVCMPCSPSAPASTIRRGLPFPESGGYGCAAAGDAARWYGRRHYGPEREATMTAPLQVIALSFSRDAGSEDRILAEVGRLRGRGVLRLLDMLFVAKSQDGTVERLTVGDDEDFGSLLAAVVPVADGDH